MIKENISKVPLKEGDIVTLRGIKYSGIGSSNSFHKFKIFRIRKDVSWEEIVQNWNSQLQDMKLSGKTIKIKTNKKKKKGR